MKLNTDNNDTVLKQDLNEGIQVCSRYPKKGKRRRILAMIELKILKLNRWQRMKFKESLRRMIAKRIKKMKQTKEIPTPNLLETLIKMILTIKK